MSKLWRKLRQQDLVDELQIVLIKFRKMRSHVRKDGSLKSPMKRDRAIALAEQMTLNHGVQFSAYPCPYPACSGCWHIGKVPYDGVISEGTHGSDANAS